MSAAHLHIVPRPLQAVAVAGSNSYLPFQTGLSKLASSYRQLKFSSTQLLWTPVIQGVIKTKPCLLFDHCYKYHYNDWTNRPAVRSVSEMAVLLCQLIVLIVLLATSHGQTDDDEESKMRLRQLYTVLRNIALPSAVSGKVVDKRLVLMMPGKVLSERDYYPGDAYVNFKKNPSVGKFEEIPPVVMQRMFRLVDIIPGLDPMQGQESGERMSVIYRQILGDMNIEGIKDIAKDKENLQKESVDFLLQVVSDPDNLQLEASRWDLYRRYEKVYNEKKREMEETIDSNRNSRSSVDYQLWFQRTFPILQAEVDGAFIDWLVKGNKDVIELYRSRLDTSSPGTLLLEAKSAMRSSGTVSLDRTETIYPVEYTPGDWFEYLKDP